MTVIELVKVGLGAGGFDGLYSPGTCGCLATELAPCGEMPTDCKAGYKQTRSDGEWIVASQKAPMGDDEISTILDDC